MSFLSMSTTGVDGEGLEQHEERMFGWTVSKRLTKSRKEAVMLIEQSATPEAKRKVVLTEKFQVPPYRTAAEASAWCVSDHCGSLLKPGRRALVTRRQARGLPFRYQYLTVLVLRTHADSVSMTCGFTWSRGFTLC